MTRATEDVDITSSPARAESPADHRSMRPPAGVKRLCVLHRFAVFEGDRAVALPANLERVFAFLAVRPGPQLRSTIATMLWMDAAEERGNANVRTALWRARQLTPGWIETEANTVAIGEDVDVDLHRMTAQARRLVDDQQELAPSDESIVTLEADLLPLWDEEWLVFERERVRQLRVHALEALCRRLSEAGRSAPAIEAGLAAVECEPLRESAQRVLVAAHLAEGNISEARRQYEAYRRLLWDQLGIEPSDQLRALVGIDDPRGTGR